MTIKLAHVEISDSARERVDRLLRMGVVGQSEVIEDFEGAFAKWSGSRYAVAVSSGTMADTIALAVLKNLKPNRERVVMPALTFAAQLNAVLYNGLRPSFIDQDGHPSWDDETLCYFPVHLLGEPKKYFLPEGMWVIEDSCEALGSEVNRKKCGTFGEMGTFSFFPSHTMTTGEGGMIVTDNSDYAEMARRLRNHGKNSGLDFRFDVIGFNGKMTSLQAALGIEALKDLDANIEARRRNFLALGGHEPVGVKISPHAFPVNMRSREERDAMLHQLTKEGIECRNLFSSLPTQEKAYAFLGHKLGEFPEAEYIGDCGLYVPCHQGLSESDIDHIKGVLGEKEETQREVLTA